MSPIERAGGLRVLLIGLGGFGRNHLRAWSEMGAGEGLYVAELREAQHEVCRPFNLPRERITSGGSPHGCRGREGAKQPWGR